MVGILGASAAPNPKMFKCGEEGVGVMTSYAHCGDFQLPTLSLRSRPHIQIFSVAREAEHHRGRLRFGIRASAKPQTPNPKPQTQTRYAQKLKTLICWSCMELERSERFRSLLNFLLFPHGLSFIVFTFFVFVMCFHCLSLFIYHCVSLFFLVFHCVSLFSGFFRCFLLCFIVFALTLQI